MPDPGRRLPLAPVAHAPDAHAAALPAMTRRSALQGLAAGLGLAASPASADAHDHPLAAHIAQRQGTTRPPATPAPAAAPLFFDAHQFATLTTAAELIVPGSVASGSPTYIDSVLAIEHDAVRLPVVSALAALDAAARDQHGTTFRALPGDRQPALLESLAAPLATLKSWVAGAHFSSEAGMKELGFTGSVFFETFPACTHADGH